MPTSQDIALHELVSGGLVAVGNHHRTLLGGHLPLQKSGKKKTNKPKHFGRAGVRDKREPSLGQTGPLPGTNWDPSLGQTGLFLFNSTVTSPFCPVCAWDGCGDDCPTRAVRKMFMCFLFIGFFFHTIKKSIFRRYWCHDCFQKHGLLTLFDEVVPRLLKQDYEAPWRD